MEKLFIKTAQILVLFSVIFAVGCKKDKEPNNPPKCSIINPSNGEFFTVNEDVTVAVVAEDSDGFIAEVQLYVDGVSHSGTKESPYNFTIKAGELTAETHILKAVAIDNKDAKTESAVVEIVVKTSPLKIGDHFQGGIVAYLDETGKHGFIAAPIDQSTDIEWGDYGVETNATGVEIGTGWMNTMKIVQAQGYGHYAAKLCADLVLEGYKDWFLPSRDELNILYRNRDLIGGFYISDTSVMYWCSSEYNLNIAWYQSFYSGVQHYGNKDDHDYIYRVRAIRKF